MDVRHFPIFAAEIPTLALTDTDHVTDCLRWLALNGFFTTLSDYAVSVSRDNKPLAVFYDDHDDRLRDLLFALRSAVIAVELIDANKTYGDNKDAVVSTADWLKLPTRDSLILHAKSIGVVDEQPYVDLPGVPFDLPANDGGSDEGTDDDSSGDDGDTASVGGEGSEAGTIVIMVEDYEMADAERPPPPSSSFFGDSLDLTPTWQRAPSDDSVEMKVPLPSSVAKKRAARIQKPLPTLTDPDQTTTWVKQHVAMWRDKNPKGKIDTRSKQSGKRHAAKSSNRKMQEQITDIEIEELIIEMKAHPVIDLTMESEQSTSVKRRLSLDAEPRTKHRKRAISRYSYPRVKQLPREEEAAAVRDELRAIASEQSDRQKILYAQTSNDFDNEHALAFNFWDSYEYYHNTMRATADILKKTDVPPEPTAVNSARLKELTGVKNEKQEPLVKVETPVVVKLEKSQPTAVTVKTEPPFIHTSPSLAGDQLARAPPTPPFYLQTAQIAQPVDRSDTPSPVLTVASDLSRSSASNLSSDTRSPTDTLQDFEALPFDESSPFEAQPVGVLDDRRYVETPITTYTDTSSEAGTIIAPITPTSPPSTGTERSEFFLRASILDSTRAFSTPALSVTDQSDVSSRGPTPSNDEAPPTPNRLISRARVPDLSRNVLTPSLTLTPTSSRETSAFGDDELMQPPSASVSRAHVLDLERVVLTPALSMTTTVSSRDDASSNDETMLPAPSAVMSSTPRVSRPRQKRTQLSSAPYGHRNKAYPSPSSSVESTYQFGQPIKPTQFTFELTPSVVRPAPHRPRVSQVPADFFSFYGLSANQPVNSTFLESMRLNYADRVNASPASILTGNEMRSQARVTSSTEPATHLGTFNSLQSAVAENRVTLYPPTQTEFVLGHDVSETDTYARPTVAEAGQQAFYTTLVNPTQAQREAVYADELALAQTALAQTQVAATIAEPAAEFNAQTPPDTEPETESVGYQPAPQYMTTAQVSDSPPLVYTPSSEVSSQAPSPYVGSSRRGSLNDSMDEDESNILPSRTSNYSFRRHQPTVVRDAFRPPASVTVNAYRPDYARSASATASLDYRFKLTDNTSAPVLNERRSKRILSRP